MPVQRPLHGGSESIRKTFPEVYQRGANKRDKVIKPGLAGVGKPIFEKVAPAIGWNFAVADLFLHADAVSAYR